MAFESAKKQLRRIAVLVSVAAMVSAVTPIVASAHPVGHGNSDRGHKVA